MPISSKGLAAVMTQNFQSDTHGFFSFYRVIFPAKTSLRLFCKLSMSCVFFTLLKHFTESWFMLSSVVVKNWPQNSKKPPVHSYHLEETVLGSRTLCRVLNLYSTYVHTYEGVYSPAGSTETLRIQHLFCPQDWVSQLVFRILKKQVVLSVKETISLKSELSGKQRANTSLFHVINGGCHQKACVAQIKRGSSHLKRSGLKVI